MIWKRSFRESLTFIGIFFMEGNISHASNDNTCLLVDCFLICWVSVNRNTLINKPHCNIPTRACFALLHFLGTDDWKCPQMSVETIKDEHLWLTKIHKGTHFFLINFPSCFTTNRSVFSNVLILSWVMGSFGTIKQTEFFVGIQKYMYFPKHNFTLFLELDAWWGLSLNRLPVVQMTGAKLLAHNGFPAF